ncbi:lipoyl(octanoyl) transferase LipB [Desulfothermus okinawensis JCM 13304]
MSHIHRECKIYIIKEPVGYEKIWKIQKHIVAEKTNRLNREDVLLILEHKSVYTIGKNGNRSNFLISEEFIKNKGIDLYEIERGGDITYHGPGQIVVYPIFNLKSLKIGVKDFVYLLEEVMIETANSFGIVLTRRDINRGVWYKDKKIGFIGISIKKGITYHGIALNVSMDLTPFSWINPCGLRGVELTDFSNIIGKVIDINKAKEIIKEKFVDVFNIKPVLTQYLTTQDINYESFKFTSEKARVA